MRISDWSSDVCSSDLTAEWPRYTLPTLAYHEGAPGHLFESALKFEDSELPLYRQAASVTAYGEGWGLYAEQVADELGMYDDDPLGKIGYLARSEEHTSELQSLMRISYAVFCLKKKKQTILHNILKIR